MVRKNGFAFELSVRALVAWQMACGFAVAQTVCPEVTQSTASGYDPNTGVQWLKTIVVTKQETAAFSPESAAPSGYRFLYHPYGTITTTTTTRYARNALPPRQTTSVTSGPIFRNICGIGDDANAGYQLKIYSKNGTIEPPEPPFQMPILVPQGFDPDYGTAKQFDFRYFEVLLSQSGTLNDLYNNGRDIAMLLFKNPNIAIETNARVFIEAWKFFQSQSVNRETKEPVIIAPSLGGIVARYAFQRLGEVGGESWTNAAVPDCRLLVLLDAPHRGADIPMSVQALVGYFRYDNDLARSLNANLTSVAAQQLLLKVRLGRGGGYAHHTISNDNNPATRDGYEDPLTVHGRFMRDLNAEFSISQMRDISNNGLGTNCNLPDREDCERRSVHIAGISVGGDQDATFLGYQEHQYYARRRAKNYDIDLHTSQTAVPATNANSQVFWGNLANRYDWKYFLYEPVFLEDVPGSRRATYKTIKDNVGFNMFLLEFADPGLHPFIPSISAMGLVRNTDINNPASYLRPRMPNPIVDPNSIFDEIFVSSSNQEHVTITPEIKAYIQSLLDIYLVSELHETP